MNGQVLNSARFYNQTIMEHHSRKSQRWTIKDVVEWTCRYFSEKRTSTPRLDAEVLLAHCLKTDRLHLYLNFDRPLSISERERYRELVRRRAHREPVALIVGTKEFWSIPFKILPGVLIPRSDTETLVQAVLEDIQEIHKPWVVEIGTGSGAVAIAILHENPEARVVATDVDPASVKLACINAKEVANAASLDCVVTDLLTAIRPGVTFDVICSNPPYIPTKELSCLEPEIREFEPLRALDGGPDGLDVIRRIARIARNFLKESGELILEVGDGQADDVAQIFADLGGFNDIRKLLDLSGKHRVVAGKF